MERDGNTSAVLVELSLTTLLLLLLLLFAELETLCETAVSKDCCFLGDWDEETVVGGSVDFCCVAPVATEDDVPGTFAPELCFSNTISPDAAFLEPSAVVTFFSPNVGQSPLFAVKSAALALLRFLSDFPPDEAIGLLPFGSLDDALLLPFP